MLGFPILCPYTGELRLANVIGTGDLQYLKEKKHALIYSPSVRLPKLGNFQIMKL